MRKTIIYAFAGLMSVMMMSSCKPKRIILPTPDPVPVESPKPDSKSNTLSLLKSKDLTFSTLSLRGKATLNLDGSENNVNMQMRIQKDKKIWVSITAIAGIEVARALITPDSIFLRNNLEKSYLKKPLTFLNSYTNKQVNFEWIQAIFTGNTIPDLLTEPIELEISEGVWVAKGQREGLAYSHLFNEIMKLSELNLNDAQAAQALQVNYTNYTTLSNSSFPMALKLNTLSGQKKIGLDINFNKADANVDLEFPFSIPRNYSQIQ